MKNRMLGVFALCAAVSAMSAKADIALCDYVQGYGNTYKPVWLDTGVVPDGNTSVEMDLELKNNSETFAIFCSCGSSATDRTYSLFHIYQKGWRFDYFNNASRQKGSAVAKDKRFKLLINNTGVYENGSSTATPAVTPAIFDGANNLVLFSAYTTAPGTSVANYAKVNVYAMKIYDGDGKLVRDFIPAIDGDDGRRGLWDRAGGKFYGVSGGGALNRGTITNESIIVTAPKDVTASSATLQSIFTTPTSSSYEVKAYYGTSPDSLDNEVVVGTKNKSATLTANATGLAALTKYYVKWTATAGDVTLESSVREFWTAGTGAYFVKPGNKAAAFPYSTWETAASSIDDVLDWAHLDPGCTITLADGTYKFDRCLNLTNQVTIASQNGRDKTFFEPAEGFTGRLCYMQSPSETLAKRPVVQGVTFRGTVSSGRSGGQVYIKYPGGLLQDCRFTGCTTKTSSDTTGGAIAMEGGGTVLRSIIDHNVGARVDGSNNGSACAAAGIVLVEGVTQKNVGGMCVENCLIVHNDGPAIRYANVTYYTPAIRNCTIADNNGYSALGAARESTFKNNIFLLSSNRLYGRFTSFGGAKSRGGNGVYNNFTPVLPEFDAGKATISGNVIGYDAMFVNPRAMDYHLRAGSPCIDKGTAFDGSGTTDLDGNPRTSGDVPDIGCYEYDPNYVGETRVLYVATDGDDANAGADRTAPLATIAHALEIAEDGTDIFLAPGAYPQSKKLVVNKPVRIFGEGGRDVTFIEPAEDAGEIGLIETQHILAEVHDLTFRNGTTTMLRQTGGGVVENCRLTGYYSTRQRDFPYGVVWFGNWGTLYRCVIDGNFHNQYCSPALVYVSGRKDDTAHATRRGYLDTCLIANNEIWYIGGQGKTRMGSCVTLTRDGSATGSLSSMVNCTVASNDLATAVSADRFCDCIKNSIITGGVSVDAEVKGRSSANCAATEIGAGSITELPAFKNPRKGNFIPKVGSSVEGKANPFLFAEDDLDLAGRPRLDEDGSQNIGCYQCFTPGLMMLVK